MILRKPYAILIKYFKLIHVVLTICMACLIYRSYMIYDFFTEYMKTNMMPLGFGATNDLVDVMLYSFPMIIIVSSVIMLLTMIKKEKPKLFYIITTTTYVLGFALYNYLATMLKTLEENIVPIRDIRLANDLILIFMTFQVGVIMMSLVRSIGFDIKKFDFKKDLLDMDIVDADNEEFEVSFNVEGNIIKRSINKFIRNLKYVYLENKFLFKILGCFAIVFCCYNLYKGSNINHKLLKVGDAFYSDGADIQLTNTYITRKDYKNETIGNNTFVLVELNIKGDSKSVKLNTARMQLKIGKEIYYPQEKGYLEKFIDLGTAYENGNLTTSFAKYLIVYEIPTRFEKKEMKFRYISNMNGADAEYSTFALEPIEIDSNTKTEDAKLGKPILLNEQILGNSSVTINSFEIKDKFTINYNYCPVNGECYASVEYIKPNLNTSFEKAIIKMDAELTVDPERKIKGVTSAFNILEKFGTVVYIVDGKTYKIKGKLVNIPAKKKKVANHFYIEVNERILKADYAYVLIKVRNKEYKYIIKNNEEEK